MSAFLFDPEQLPVDKLTEGHLHELRKLNDKLAIIEKQIVQQGNAIRAFYASQVQTMPRSVEDFELDVKISFDLKETDPLYNLENCNELESLCEHLCPLNDSDGFGLADGINHNEFQHMSNHPLKEEHHCWVYHCLYDHTKLGWINILRIGEIRISINADFQRIYAEHFNS